jgi:uncharacterized protein YprB with RNaseH-like and TPR domain
MPFAGAPRPQDMENALRKRLEILKSRAREIRRLHLARYGIGPPVEAAPPRTLAEAAHGEEVAIGSSALYVIRTDASNVADDALALAAAFSELTETASWRRFALGPGGAREGLPDRISAGDFCFFDIETTGLTPSTYVFLCGMMVLRDDRFVVEQAFARDYAEEAGMLLYVRRALERCPVLVTFNGASFDVPFVKARMAVARIDYGGPREHVDLLLPARQRFGGTLANCRLETIERHLRGARSESDIPGSEIPEAYHEFVRTGDARTIGRIIYHNRMDLIAMVVLFNRLLEPK